MKDNLNDLVFYSAVAGANTLMTIESLVDGRWLGAVLSAAAAAFCFVYGRKNYATVASSFPKA